MCEVFQGQTFKIIITAKSNHHGTTGELLPAAERCARLWAKLNGFDVRRLSVQTKGLVWSGRERGQRVTAEANLKNA